MENLSDVTRRWITLDTHWPYASKLLSRWQVLPIGERMEDATCNSWRMRRHPHHNTGLRTLQTSKSVLHNSEVIRIYINCVTLVSCKVLIHGMLTTYTHIMVSLNEIACSLVNSYSNVSGKNCRLHLLHWRWKQHVSPKCYLSTKIHSGTFQKTVILRFHAVKITYLNNHWEHTVMRYPIVHFCKSWQAFTNKHYRIWLSTHSHTHHTTCCRC